MTEFMMGQDGKEEAMDVKQGDEGMIGDKGK